MRNERETCKQFIEPALRATDLTRAELTILETECARCAGPSFAKRLPDTFDRDA